MSQTLALLPILEQAQLLRDRQVSSVELLQVYLDRIERLDAQVNAYITVSRAEAIAAARAADDQLRQGVYEGPLHGVPVALKDQMRIAGVRTTGGSHLFTDFVPTDDATVVARLRKAGAVLLGTLNTNEFHMGGGTRTWPFGTPMNPWDPRRTPGGSSSGPAAAVAAALCSGALGEDTGGSIRGPASYCGITGLKPTWSRVSRHGIFTLCWSMDCVGPMTRSAADAAAILRCIAGHDPADPTSSRAGVPDYLAEIEGSLGAVRVGVLEEMTDESVDAETRQAVKSAVEVLRGLGARVGTASLPLIKLGRAVHTAVVDAEAASYHRERLLTRYDEFEYNTRVRLMVGSVLPSGLHTLATRLKAAIGRQVSDAFEEFDVLIGATSTSVAPFLEEEPVVTSKEDALTKLFGREGAGANTTAFNMAGVPAVSVPCGFGASGMPIGLHISGRHFEEGLVLRVAHAYQRVTGWHVKSPQLMEG